MYKAVQQFVVGCHETLIPVSH